MHCAYKLLHTIAVEFRGTLGDHVRTYYNENKSVQLLRSLCVKNIHYLGELQQIPRIVRSITVMEIGRETHANFCF